VTLQGMAVPRKSCLATAKLQRHARKKKINYAWVDTCCIDKTSSAELSESINAMFAWYRHSEICLTYLSDLLHSMGPDFDENFFAKSKWFTRGWTLQELLSSIHIEFYDNIWTLIGTKQDLLHIISRVTGIQVRYITGGIDSILAASVGTRMFRVFDAYLTSAVLPLCQGSRRTRATPLSQNMHATPVSSLCVNAR
jgi:hypothetical protein